MVQQAGSMQPRAVCGTDVAERSVSGLRTKDFKIIFILLLGVYLRSFGHRFY